MNLRAWLRLGAALMTCALASCGGGGGGDEDLSVSTDRDSFSLVSVNGSDIVSLPITFTMKGGSGTYYGMAVPDAEFLSANFEPVSDSEATVTLSFYGVLMSPGTRKTGNVSFRLCSDARCDKVVWSRQIPYTLSMYGVSTAAVAISGHEKAQSETVSRAIVPEDPLGEVVFTANQDFLALDHTRAGQVDITADATSLPAGSYGATISIGVRIDGLTMPGSGGVIPVNLGVSSGILDPAAAPIDILATSTPDSVQGEAPIRFVEGQATAWSATTDSPWLVLDTSSGVGPGTVTYHVDTTKIGDIANWSSASAQITIKGPPLADRVFNVTLNKKLAEVRLVTPTALLANQPSNVRVVGRGLAQIAGPGGFDVGGVRPLGVTIESDTAATLQMPSLATGVRSITAINQIGDTPSASASVAVVEAGVFQTAAVPNIAEPRAAVVDPARNAVFAADSSQQALVRFKLVSGQWRITRLPIANVGRLALSPDRRTVYVVSGSNLVAVDPDAMRVRATHRGTIDLSSVGKGGQPLPVTNDLRLWLATEHWSELTYFDLRTGAFGTQSAVIEGGSQWPLEMAVVFSPADGSQGFIANNVSPSDPPDNYWYSPATGSVTRPEGAPHVYYNAHFDDRGTGLLIDHETLYQPQGFAIRGLARIPRGSGRFGASALVSPDGRRIYRQVAESGSGEIIHIQVFDTSRLVDGSTDFVTLGTIALPAQANDCQPYETCAKAGLLIIDPTGTTLFSVGRSRMLVMPIPDNLSGISATQGSPARMTTSRLRKATGQ